MSTLETYKQEIETELDRAMAKLIELKATIRGFSDVERIQSLEDVEKLETMTSDMRAKTQALNEEMEATLAQIKGDIGSSQKTINEAFSRLNRSLV